MTPGQVGALAVALGSLAGCSVVEHACTDIGCESGLRVPVVAIQEADAQRLVGAYFEICLNGACVGSMIPGPPPANEARRVRVTAPSDLNPYVDLYMDRAADGNIQIAVQYYAHDHRLFMDGDRYTVTLLAADSPTERRASQRVGSQTNLKSSDASRGSPPRPTGHVAESILCQLGDR